MLASLAGSQRYVEVEPVLFQRADGQRVNHLDHLSFLAEPNGARRYLLADKVAFQKLPWHETLGFNLLFTGAIVLLFLSVPAAALIWRLSPRWRALAAQQPRGARLARWLLGGLTALFFASQVGLFSAFADQDAYLQGLAYATQVGEWLAIPITLLALGAVIGTLATWARRYWTRGWRLNYTLVTLGALAQVWWFFNW